MSSRVSGRVERKNWKVAGIILALGLLVTTGCHKKRQSGDIVMDDSVPSDQADRLAADLDRLGQISFTDYGGEDVMDTTDFSANGMRAWLNARITRVVGEDFQAEVDIVRSNQPYNTTVFAEQQKQLNEDSVKTVMSNLGGAIYLKGKAQSTLYSLLVGGDSVTVDTPRVGIIQIGEGLFTVNRVKSSELDAPANTYLRLSTLFHEARHSDGNGDDVAMPHAKCPSGTYKDHYACESRSNGPYTVGRVMLERFLSYCTQNGECNQTEQTSLSMSAKDYGTRIIGTPRKASSEPERVSD